MVTWKTLKKTKSQIPPVKEKKVKKMKKRTRFYQKNKTSAAKLVLSYRKN